MGKSKTTTSNEPSAYAKQYITPAADALAGGYAASQPGVAHATDLINGGIDGVAKNAFGTSPLLAAANGNMTDILSGKYLGQGNPYMNSLIDQTDQSVGNKVNSTFGAAGRTGSGAHTQVLSKSLADSENNTRYTNYAAERQAMMQALGMVPGMELAQYAGIAPLLALAQGTTLPTQNAAQYAGGVGSLVGNYNTQTQTSSPSLFDMIMKGVGTAASVAGAASDRRLKTNIEKVDTLTDGLGIYDFDYIWPGERQRGVMADEVAKLRPWALGATVGGYATVHYDRLEAA